MKFEIQEMKLDGLIGGDRLIGDGVVPSLSIQTLPGSNRMFWLPIPSEKNRNVGAQSRNLRTNLDS